MQHQGIHQHTHFNAVVRGLIGEQERSLTSVIKGQTAVLVHAETLFQLTQFGCTSAVPAAARPSHNNSA